MGHRVPLVASTTLGLVLSSLVAAAAKPEPCAPGRFLVDPAKAPLLESDNPPAIDAVEFATQSQVAIDSGCSAATAHVKATRKLTKLMVKWTSCGAFQNVRLTAKIKAPGCTALSGKLKVGKSKAKTFTAALSTCGDGTLDVVEDCESANPCPGGQPCQDCTCALSPCGSAARPECAGACEAPYTCRDVFLVGCACFL